MLAIMFKGIFMSDQYAFSKVVSRRFIFSLALLVCLLCFGNRAGYAAADCGTPSFNSPPSFRAGTNPNSVAAGDLNGDGALDLAVTDYTNDTLSVLIGDGEGAFLPPATYPIGIKLQTVGASPRAVAIGDLNGDGKLDIVAAGGYAAGWVSVLLGDGTGNFGPVMSRETINNGAAMGVVLGDFNGDGKKDVSVAGSSAAKATFLLGDGAGGFTSTVSVAVGAQTDAIAAGDFNGDGLTDVVVAKFGGGLDWGLAFINGSNSGNFIVNQTIKMNSQPKALAVADFNRDGKLDVAFTFGWATTGVEILLGDGAGGFGPPEDIFTIYDPISLTTGDFNEDGNPDLAVYTSSANSLAILSGVGNGHFYSAHYVSTLAGTTFSMVVGDFNKDGHKDIVTTHYNGDAVALLAGDGTGYFAAPRVKEERGGRIATADFNNDGRPDLAIPGGYSDDVQIYLNNSLGGVAEALHYPAGRTPSGVVTGDFNHDGKIDLVLSHDIYAGYVTVLLGNGAGGFSAPINTDIGGASNVLVAGDFDNDSNLDLALLIGYNGSKVAIMRGNGAGGFSAPVYPASGVLGAWIATGDFNGDGKLDLAVANAFPINGSILLGDGAGGFSLSSYSPLQIPERVTYLRVADINKDGRPDLITSHNEINKLAILLNNGAGFDPAKTIDLPNGPQYVAVADFNADGNPDLAVPVGNSPVITNNNSPGNIAVLSGDGLGNFSAPSYFTAGGPSVDITVADFNGDGKPDLATPDYTTVLLNTFKPQPCLSVNDVTVTETDSGTTSATFNVTLSALSTETIKVNYFLKDHTATSGTDYLPISGRLVFAPGVTSQSLTVTVMGDVVDEVDEDFYLLLSNPANADLGKAQGTGTITDNDPEPTININDLSIKEDSFAGATFDVTLSAPSAKRITVAFNVTDGTTTAGSDYYSYNTSGTLTFAPGEKSGKISLSIIGDTTFEPDETFFVNLSNPVNATLARAQAQGTIINDDSMPKISVQDMFISEADPNVGNASFVVRLSNASSQPVTVNYATADDTAKAGSDYIAASGTLTFNPGVTDLSVIVPVINDNQIEPTESFTLNLSNPVNATIAQAQGRGNIFDDDTPNISFTSSRYTVNEGAGFATITVRRNGGTSTAATVEYATSDGSALQRTKYTTSTGTLSFAPGETSKTFTVLITDGAYQEGDQTVILILRNPTGGAVLVTPKSAVLTILDNDTAPPALNPINDAQVFVRQHYYDFLNRVPDTGGLGYWTDQITRCGTDAACINERRIGVSAAYFIELEFQETGSVVYRLYKAAYGVRPTYDQFMPDRSQLVGGPQLQASTLDFANRFVQRDTFKLIYPDTMSATDFVKSLFDTAGLIPFTDERQQELQALAAGSKTRAQVLLDVINLQAFKDREYNPSFVLMQYFGYLRRDPEEGGYQFWLNVLSNKEPGNYRGMVCSFITSREYQERFSSISTRSNQDCANIH
jgi:hypothetical protein